MTEHQIKILDKYRFGRLTKNEFSQEFGKEIKNVIFIKNEIIRAIESENVENIERAIHLIWFHENPEYFINELNFLILEPNHRSHQLIVRAIQDLKNPKSIPFIRTALKTNFEYLKYTCSSLGVIAKWFSWALYSIGTKESIKLIEEYTQSENVEIRNEMIYRLKKYRNKNEHPT